MHRALAYFCFLVVISRCQGQEASQREPGFVSTVTPVFGPNTFVNTTTSTTTTSTTTTSTSSGTSTAPGTGLLDNSPPAPLSLSGGQVVTADRPEDCPNDVCELSPDPSVTSALSTFTSTTTNTSQGTTTFSETNAPIRNYFKTICLVTQIIDLYQPIYYENCATISGEGFYVQTSGQFTLFHPSSRHDLCINAPGTPTTGEQLDLAICDGSAGQNWILDFNQTPVTLVHPSADTTLCVVRGGNANGNLTIGLWTCDVNNTNLMWESGL